MSASRLFFEGVLLIRVLIIHKDIHKLLGSLKEAIYTMQQCVRGV